MMYHTNKTYDDVIVVGAGPAGATAACLLAREGVNVTVIEKAVFPRFKLCGGLITWKTIQVLKNLFQVDLKALESHDIILRQHLNYGISDFDKQWIHGQLDFPFTIVDRQKYDQYWLKLAKDSGARIVASEKVVSMDLANSSLQTESGKRFSSEFILGADGALSRIRACLAQSGLIDDRTHLRANALEVYVDRMNCPEIPDYPVLFFGLNQNGYGWSIPQRDQITIGVCGLRKRVGPGLKPDLHKLLSLLGIPENRQPSFKGHPLPCGNYLEKPGHANILLLGDAAGFADPLLGEGIYYAHRSGEIAARSIIYAKRDGVDQMNYYINNLKTAIISEFKFARIWRAATMFTIERLGMRAFAYIMNRAQKRIEETIQGKRSFSWLKTKRFQ